MKLIELFEHVQHSTQITKIAQQYANQFEETHVATGPASRFNWRYEPHYGLDRIAYKKDAVELFKSDQKAWADDGDPHRYDDLLNEPIHEPIVIVEIGGLSYIWDGNHRVAASLLTNRSTIPAYVGVLK